MAATYLARSDKLVGHLSCSGDAHVAGNNENLELKNVKPAKHTASEGVFNQPLSCLCKVENLDVAVFR